MNNMLMKKIIDLSSHEGPVDWDVLAPLVAAVILRAGYGCQKDERFEEYYAGATRIFASIYSGALAQYINVACVILPSGTVLSLSKDFTNGAWAGNETGVYITINGFYECT